MLGSIVWHHKLFQIIICKNCDDYGDSIKSDLLIDKYCSVIAMRTLKNIRNVTSFLSLDNSISYLI